MKTGALGRRPNFAIPPKPDGYETLAKLKRLREPAWHSPRARTPPCFPVEFRRRTLDVVVNPPHLLLQGFVRQVMPVRVRDVASRQGDDVRSVHDAPILESLPSFDGDVFVPSLDHSDASVVRQFRHRVCVDEFERSAGKAQIAGNVEDARRLVEFRRGARNDVASQHGTPFHLDVGDGAQLALVDAVGFVYVSGLVGEGERDGSEFQELGGYGTRVFS